MLPFIAKFGKSLNSFTDFIGGGAKKQELAERKKKLEARIREGSEYERLQAQDSWKKFNSAVEERLAHVRQQYQNVSVDGLNLLQAQEAELVFVSKIVPDAVLDAKQAREEFERMGKENRESEDV